MMKSRRRKPTAFSVPCSLFDILLWNVKQMQRILVTGSAGKIGRAAVRELKARGHFVRGFDLAPSPLVDERLTGSVTDAEAFQRAATGMQSLIHLAATPDDADF